jgi:hypothetical protein
MTMLKPYTGLIPSNVNKDAKYTVSVSGDIRLVYYVSNRVRELLATNDHGALADMVNAVKTDISGVPGGSFYINEYGDVLVPSQDGNCYWAGNFDSRLEFRTEDGVVVTPSAPHDLEPGDAWPGPHVGIRYVLMAGGQDVRYERKVSERRVEIVQLSDEVETAAARQTAARIAAVKGASGGRFYINEAGEMFGPVSSNDFADFVYIGHIEDSSWFKAPHGYERA